MSTTTFQFTFEVGGVKTNVTSVVLSDPTGTFGAQRTDTDATVVADGTAMTNVATGVYQYELTDPSEGLSYIWWAEYVYNGVTNRAQFTTEATGVDEPGEYGTRAGMEFKCGARNLYDYENLERGQYGATVTDNAVAAAIEDDLAEANADMAVAWREFTDVTLGYTSSYELRWLNDTAEYGGVCKAWAGRNVSRGNTDDVPQQIATALDEWARRLQMLRDGKALQDYYDANADEDDEAQAGTFQSVPLTFNDDNDVVDEYAT